jgi:hypothetical protein
MADSAWAEHHAAESSLLFNPGQGLLRQSRFAAVRHKAYQLLLKMELLLLAAAMALTEVESPALLRTCALTATLVLACNVYLVWLWGLGGAAAVVMVLSSFSVMKCRLVRKLESMDEFAKRIQERVGGLTRGLHGDALGPNSRAPQTVPRQSSSDLAALMLRAEALKDDFERIVVDPLSQYGDTKCGL